MKIIKKQSKQTYVNKKNGEEKHYYNYFIQGDNGKRVQIKPAFIEDKRTLDAWAEYEATKQD